ncbi:MAG TPA: VWA domain-containing protein [Candidatus Limnocylindrales bacterium]|nr:VWA domain-containing protein [Candidatus Limnocylindrales bacterium]
MEFLNPAALFGLLALPVLLIPYLIRRKSQRMAFSSLLLFLESSEAASSKFWGRINLPPIFFLQLLLLALLIIALSEPVFSIHPTNIAVILDNSASMQALEDEKSRFTLAKERASALVSELGAGGKVDLFMTTPRLEKLHGAPLSPAEATRLIATQVPYDLAEPPVDYDNMISQLARQQKYERVYLITDHPARGQSAAARVITVGRPHANFALTALEIQRSSLANARLEALVEVANYSERDEKLKIILKGSGIELANRVIDVGKGKTTTVSFEGFADHPTYAAEIANRDALPLDNRRFAVAPGSRNLRVLGITPRPRDLESLKAIPGVQIDTVAPSEYDKAERSGYALEIYHFATPAALPANAALFILPPQSSSIVDLGAAINNVTISNWRDPHVLTRYINFNLFRPTFARPLKPQTAGDIILDSAGGPLAFATERQGVRYLTLGFDPLPYLGRDNLPMSVFTLNLLDWFFDSRGANNQATGEAIFLGKVQSGDRVILPGGKSLTITPGAAFFGGAFFQGIYQLNRGGKTELFARNLFDRGESDLQVSAPLPIGGNQNSPSASLLFSFWPYILMACIALLLLEWFLSPHMTARGRWHSPARVAQRS